MTVVVGYLPGAYGRAALRHGVEEAGMLGTRLVVVNATKGDAFVDTHFASDEAVGTLDRRLDELKVDHEIRQVLGSDIAAEILHVVEEVEATRLVIGLRRRSPVGKLFMGSVAQRLLLDCPCPILAVKPDPHDADVVGEA